MNDAKQKANEIFYNARTNALKHSSVLSNYSKISYKPLNLSIGDSKYAPKTNDRLQKRKELQPYINRLNGLSDSRIDEACKNVDKIANDVVAGKRSKDGPFTVKEQEDWEIYDAYHRVLLSSF